MEPAFLMPFHNLSGGAELERLLTHCETSVTSRRKFGPQIREITQPRSRGWETIFPDFVLHPEGIELLLFHLHLLAKDRQHRVFWAMVLKEKKLDWGGGPNVRNVWAMTIWAISP